MSLFGGPPDFNKFTSVQLAQGTWTGATWHIPKNKRKLVAHNLRCFRKEYKHISTADVTQFMHNRRFVFWTRAIPK